MFKQAFFMYAFFALFILCGGACEKENKEPELPPITQSGANTFGCLVNGEVWLPQKGMITVPPFSVSNTVYKDKRWIIQGNNLTQNVTITICQDSVLKGTSTFDFESEDNCSSARFNDTGDEREYYFTDGGDYNGEVTITKLDIDKQIIAGTFYFDAKSDKGNKVQIRDGRFDLKIYSYEP